MRAGGLTYFAVGDSLGAPLWVSDGTAEGTFKVLSADDANRYATPIGALGNELLFSVEEDGDEYWLTDGTVAGTRRLISLRNLNRSIRVTLIVEDRFYFLAEQNGHLEPWISDGTREGTHSLATSIVFNDSGFNHMVRVGNYVVFTATTDDAGRELWRINLNSGAVTQLTDIVAGPDSGVADDDLLTTLGNAAVFAALDSLGERQLWRTDATVLGTRILIDNNSGSIRSPLAIPGPVGTGRLLVIMDNLSAGYSEPWGTDGNTADQVVGSFPVIVGFVGTRAYYTVMNRGILRGLYETDGTSPGTRLVPGIPVLPAHFEVAGTNDVLYVRQVERIDPGESPATMRIYRHDFATNTTTRLKTTPYLDEPNAFHAFGFSNGRLFFDGYDEVTGREPWTSDGTTAGTRRLRNLAPETLNESSYPQEFVGLRDKLYFTADDGLVGRELWLSDGTSAGTRLVKDINPGPASSEIEGAFASSKRTYFFAKDATGTIKLWTSVGTEESTRPVRALSRPTVGFDCGARSVEIGDYTYFSAYQQATGEELWRTDGTSTGTQRVTDISPAMNSSRPCWLTAMGQVIYFSASANADTELWKFDTETQIASRVRGINPGPVSSNPSYLTELEGRLYFFANDGTHNIQLWRTDGTSAGTDRISRFDPALQFLQLESLQVINGRLMFLEHSANVTAEVWRSDGTTSGTRKMSDTTLYGDYSFFRGNGTHVYFPYDGGVGSGIGKEPWVSDGTVAGTHLLRDIRPGSQGSNSDGFKNFNGIMMFLGAQDSEHFSLWRTNGTTEGTKVVAELGGINIFNGYPALGVGNNFFYVDGDQTTGLELFALANDPPQATADNAGSVTAGGSIAIDVLANDSDADGGIDRASVAIERLPEGGTATVNKTGTVTYRPRAGFSGADSFTYSVADDQGSRTRATKVSMTVTAP